MKYRKKPVVVEAIEFTGWNYNSCLEFVGEPIISVDDEGIPYNGFPIETLEGTMTASIGDYIIKGAQGEFYPCKPDIFRETYEEVTE